MNVKGFRIIYHKRRSKKDKKTLNSFGGTDISRKNITKNKEIKFYILGDCARDI